jgi:trimeric autotransporter adhesin
MKKTIITFLGAFMLLVFVNQAFAQVPQAFNYQAVARNAAGTLLQNQALGVKLDIHQGTATGTVVYSERQTPTTNNFGLFTVSVGQGTPLSGTFNTILWSSGSYWLEVGLDVSGGTTYTAMGTSQLLSVPYAMYAGSAPSTGLPMGTSGQTLRHDGTNWVANSLLYNNGTKIGINTLTPSGIMDVNYDANIYTQFGLPSGALMAKNGSIYTYLAYGTYAAIFNGNVVPNFSNTYDLGSTSYGFKDIYMAGELNRTSTGAANMVPIAYGGVNSTGVIFPNASTTNFTCTKTGTGTYSITITGETYFYSSYVTTITLMAASGTVRTDSGSGNLYIYTFDATGAAADRMFQFVVYKP